MFFVIRSGVQGRGFLDRCWFLGDREFFDKKISGGVLASTWVLKQKEHTRAHEDPFKTCNFVVSNDNYALAA